MAIAKSTYSWRVYFKSEVELETFKMESLRDGCTNFSGWIRDILIAELRRRRTGNYQPLMHSHVAIGSEQTSQPAAPLLQPLPERPGYIWSNEKQKHLTLEEAAQEISKPEKPFSLADLMDNSEDTVEDNNTDEPTEEPI